MSLLQILVLSIVQGITEFLPISSSGHLILVPKITGWPDQGLAIDVATHVGTLLAVLVYFWRDVGRMLVGVGKLCIGRLDGGGRLALYLVLATIPALAVGYVVEKHFAASLRSIEVIAWAMLGYAVVLYVVDRSGLTLRRLEHITWGQALFIGIAQCLAFIPGTSRSGVTMVAARLLAYERAEAARFSFLLSIPAISAAGIWEGYGLFKEGDAEAIHAAVLAAGFSAFAGFVAIAVLMAWLRRATFKPFVIYRLLLGGVLLYLVYMRGW